MKSTLTFLLLIVAINCWSQQYSAMLESIDIDSFRLEERMNYLTHINPEDSLCTSDIRKAELQSKDSLSFIVMHRAFGDFIRYAAELKTVVNQQGLRFDYRYMSDDIYPHQTVGCDKDYMDKKLFEKYGRDFRTKIYDLADSMFLVNHRNDTLIYWYCDVEPKLVGKEYVAQFTSLKVSLPIKVKTIQHQLQNGDKYTQSINPTLTIQFTIDKEGHISSFRIADFIAGLRRNRRFEKKLFGIAVDEIKKNYSQWTPATIQGENINSMYLLKIGFSKQPKQRS